MDVKDFAKEQKDLYFPKTEPSIIDVPEMLFLMIDGEGAPDPVEGSSKDVSAFQKAVGALYGLAYSIKMSEKKGLQPTGYFNFKVPPLEALWWMKSGQDFDMTKPDEWRWTMMLRVPEYVTKEVVLGFADELVKKKKNDIYKKVRLAPYKEGPSVQLMHIGPYATEGPNIKKMHEYAEVRGYSQNGKHHEIYFGDPRKSAPDKLKTVLRQPIQKT